LSHKIKARDDPLNNNNNNNNNNLLTTILNVPVNHTNLQLSAKVTIIKMRLIRSNIVPPILINKPNHNMIIQVAENNHAHLNSLSPWSTKIHELLMSKLLQIVSFQFHHSNLLSLLTNLIHLTDQLEGTPQTM